MHASKPSLLIVLSLGSFLACSPWCAPPAQAQPKPVPRMQTVPLPHHQISFQRHGRELTRYHYAPNLNRPFLYPVLGPSGRSLTRMGHPHDPESHSHHNSLWISHHNVNGVDFWGDRGRPQGKILHQRIVQFVDGDDEAFVEVVNHWQTTNSVLLEEQRRITVRHLPEDEYMILIDLRLQPRQESVTLGKTPFGLIGVRMAKTIGVHDGGGTIRNDSGAVNEEGVFWKPARWVDYSGWIAPGHVEGLTLMDAPGNLNHPSVYHVRNDGWMGASLSFANPLELTAQSPLSLSYAIYVHARSPGSETLDQHWQELADRPVPNLSADAK